MKLSEPSVQIRVHPWLTLLSLAALFCGCLLSPASPTTAPISTPTPFDASKIDLSKISPEEIAATERHRDALRAEAKTKLEEQAAVVSDQSKTLADIKAANEATKRSFETYQAAAEAQIERGNKAIAALDHVLKKLHLAKWIMCGIWLALCLLIALRIPALGMYIGGGLAVAGITFIWLWI